MIAAALASTPGQPLRITGGNPDHLGDAFAHAFAQTGTGIAQEPNGDLLITRPDELQPVSITTDVYPGFPTDLQAQWTVLMTQAAGPSTVTDTIYSDRFKHIPELNRMGINARVEDNTVHIDGTQHVMGAEVMSTDLRASVSLVLAGMIAEGTTDVLRVYHLDRGYEHLEQKLNAAGAKVERVAYDEFATPAPQEA
jgi:UDP-N-acetylglucosamine 1-carboxyvinyltransferase